MAEIFGSFDENGRPNSSRQRSWLAGQFAGKGLEEAVAGKADAARVAAVEQTMNGRLSPTSLTTTIQRAITEQVEPQVTGLVTTALADDATIRQNMVDAITGTTGQYVAQTFALRDRGNWTIGLGDSNTAEGAEPPHEQSMFEQAVFQSRQQIAKLRNAGVSGDKLADMAARLDRDVLAYRPDRVIFMGGTNDATTSQSPLTSMQATARGIFDRITATGAALAVVSVLPINDVASIKQKVIDFNTWLRQEAAARNLPFVDIHTPLSDGTGAWAAGYNRDNLHLSPAGAKLAGQTVATALGLWWKPGTPVDLSTAGNLLVNPNLTDGGGDGIPDGWTQSNAPTVATVGLTADPRGFTWVTIDRLGPGGSFSLNQSVSTGFKAGDVLEVAVRVRQTSPGPVTYSVFTNNFDASSVNKGTERAAYRWTATTLPASESIIRRSYKVPDGVTRVQLYLHTEAGDGAIDFAQPVVRNLTALGRTA